MHLAYFLSKQMLLLHLRCVFPGNGSHDLSNWATETLLCRVVTLLFANSLFILISICAGDQVYIPARPWPRLHPYEGSFDTHSNWKRSWAQQKVNIIKKYLHFQSSLNISLITMTDTVQPSLFLYMLVVFI